MTMLSVNPNSQIYKDVGQSAYK